MASCSSGGKGYPASALEREEGGEREYALHAQVPLPHRSGERLGQGGKARLDRPVHSRGTQPRSGLLYGHGWRPRRLPRHQHGRRLPDPCCGGAPFHRARGDHRVTRRDDPGGPCQGCSSYRASGPEVRLELRLERERRLFRQGGAEVLRRGASALSLLGLVHRSA
jgi:hypothetical protein